MLKFLTLCASVFVFASCAEYVPDRVSVETSSYREPVVIDEVPGMHYHRESRVLVRPQTRTRARVHAEFRADVPPPHPEGD